MEQPSHHGSVLSVIMVTRFAVMASFKTHWGKKYILEINLLLLVQVEGIVSGCEESYMDMN